MFEAAAPNLSTKHTEQRDEAAGVLTTCRIADGVELIAAIGAVIGTVGTMS